MIHTLSLVASAVAALGQLVFALAARSAGGPVPRAFARVALALACWSAAVFLEDLLGVGSAAAWIVALSIPPLGLALAARVGAPAPRLERAAGLAWLLAAATAIPLVLLGDRFSTWAALLLYPGLAAALLALRSAMMRRGRLTRGARGFLVAGGLTVAASAIDTFPELHPGFDLPRLAALASLVLVAQLGTSVARHRLFELQPLLGRTATLLLVALGVAVGLAEALERVAAPWGRRLLAGFVLLAFALLQQPLLRALRSPRARAHARRRRELLRRLEAVDETLARSVTLDELERGLLGALASDPELASARLVLRRGRASRVARPGELALPLRAGRRRRGTLFLAPRDPALLRARPMRRALRSLASRVAIAASALKLQERRRRIERLAHLGSLAAALAHEIKNPLGAMLGALELLDPTAPASPPPPDGDDSPAALTPAEQRRWLDVLRQESLRLDRTVTDALALGRAPQLERRKVAPRELAEGARLLAQERARALRVESTLRLDARTGGAKDGEALVELDPDQVRHALLNLLLNAISVQPQGGRVELALEGRPGAIAFHVRDDGPGIPDELRTKVFEPFFTTRPTGSGIGLAVAQRVAAAHGGTLEIAEPDGGFRGAHFVLTIPVGRGGRDGAR
jgi:signal transduction histidine kinase